MMDTRYIGRWILMVELPEKRKRRRPYMRFMDVVRENMAVVEVTEEDADDRIKWRWKMCCGETGNP